MKKRWIIAGMIAALCLSACSQGNSAADTAAKTVTVAAMEAVKMESEE